MAYTLDTKSDSAASRGPNYTRTELEFVYRDTAHSNDEMATRTNRQYSSSKRHGHFPLLDPLNGRHRGNVSVTAVLKNDIWDITYKYSYFEYWRMNDVFQHAAELLEDPDHSNKTMMHNMKVFLKKASPELISKCSDYFGFEDNDHGNSLSRKNIIKIFAIIPPSMVVYCVCEETSRRTRTAPTIVEQLPSCNPFGKCFGYWDDKNDEHGVLVKKNPMTDQAIDHLLMDDATLQKHIGNSSPCRYRVQIMRFLATIWE